MENTWRRCCQGSGEGQNRASWTSGLTSHGHCTITAGQPQLDWSLFQLSLALHGHLDVLAVLWGVTSPGDGEVAVAHHSA